MSATKVEAKTPFAGFWLRALAFFIDIFLLQFAFYMLVFLLKEHLFALGRLNYYVGDVLVVLYFTLANGPVGRGSTVGKLIFKITTLDYEGQALSFSQALVRSLIQLHLIPVMLLLSFFPTPGSLFVVTLNSLGPVLILAFLVANIVLVSTHPFKQGFHDLAARSLVLREPSRVSYGQLREANREQFPRWQRSALQSSVIAFIVMCGVAGFQLFSQRQMQRTQLELYREVSELFSLPNFEPPRPQFVAAEGLAARLGERPSLNDAATSPAVQQASSGEVVLLLNYIRYGRISPEEISDRRAFESLFERLERWTRERFIPEYGQIFPPGVERISRLVLRFAQPIGFRMHPYEETVGYLEQSVSILIPVIEPEPSRP